MSDIQLFKNLESEGAKYIYVENIAFKVVLIMSLAVHIIDQKISFHICVVGNLLNTFMEHNIYLIS